MSNAGFAPATAPRRSVVGPVCTSFGFRYWYLACFQDAIVAVPQSFLAGVAFSFSGASRPLVVGLRNQLVADLITGPGRRLRAHRPAMLERMLDSQLRSKPNITFPTSHLRSIRFKVGKVARAGLMVAPDIILQTNSGRKHIYGVLAQDFEKAHAQLFQMYPQLCNQ